MAKLHEKAKLNYDTQTALGSILGHYLSFLNKYRYIFLGAVLLVWLLAAWGLRNFKMSVSLDDIFISEASLEEKNSKLTELFGSQDNVGIYVELDNIFSKENLIKLQRLEEELYGLESIENIISVVSFWDNFQEVELKDASLEDISTYRKFLQRQGSIFDSYVDKDLNHAWLLLNIDTAGGEFNDLAWGENLEDLLQKFMAVNAIKLIPVGLPINKFRIFRDMQADLIPILILGAIISLLLIILVMRDLSFILITILAVIFNLGFSFGLMSWLNISADSTFILVPILLTISSTIGYIVHIKNCQQKLYASGYSLEESLQLAFRENLTPTLVTCLTTVACLASFLFIPVKSIQWTGISSALMLLLVLLTLLVLLPLILLSLKQVPRTSNRYRFSSYLEKHIKQLGMASFTHKKSILIISLAILLLSAIMLPRLRVSISTESTLGTKIPYVKDLLKVSGSNIGAGGFYYIIIKKNSNILNSADFINLDKFIGELEQLHNVKRVSSILDIVRGMGNLRYGSPELPQKDSILRGALLNWQRLTKSDTADWFNAEENGLLLRVQVEQSESGELVTQLTNLNKLLDQFFSPAESAEESFEYWATGGVLQVALMNQAITRGLLLSLLSSLLVIGVLLTLFFKNLLIGLIALIPNIMPILAIGTIMVLSNESLEFVSMTVGPIILGLAVDDTVHFINNIKKYIKLTSDFKEALFIALGNIGSSLIQTTLILAGLFSILLFSEIHNIQQMGLYTVVGLVVALLSDLFVTPILIKISYAKYYRLRSSS